MNDSASALAARLAGCRRILVLGSPGSGKSWLTAALADLMQLPSVRMDDLYWRAGWQRPDAEAFDRRLIAALGRPRWIVDGNYVESLAIRWRYADAAVFVDMPTWICLLRVARRGWQRWLKRDDSMPAAVRADRRRLQGPDFRFVWKLLTFRRRTRPRVLATLAADAVNRPVLIVSRSAIVEFSNDLTH